MLDVATYENVEADRSSTGQAMSVVVLSAMAAGVGAHGFGGSRSLVPAYTAIALIAWAAWALLTYQIGAKLLPNPDTEVDVAQLLRTIGFASAPGILRVVGMVPAMAAPAFGLTSVWMLLAMVVAVRQALDYTSTGRALAVCGIGWGLTLVMLVLFGILAAPAVS
jgi:hypothetical protein